MARWPYGSHVRRASVSSAPWFAEGLAVLVLTSAAVVEVSTDPGRTGPVGLHVSVVMLLGIALLVRRRLGAAAPVLGGVAVVVQCAVGFAVRG